MFDNKVLRVIIRKGKKIWEPLDEYAPRPPVDPIFFPNDEQKIIINCIDNFVAWYLKGKQFGRFIPKGPKPPEIFNNSQIRKIVKQEEIKRYEESHWFISWDIYYANLRKFQKLPFTKSKIRGNIKLVPFAIKYGFQFEIADVDDFVIEGQPYVLRVDSSLYLTADMLEWIDGIVLGDGVYVHPGLQHRHISSPVSYSLLDDTKPIRFAKKLRQRPYWINFMSAQKYHRDRIAVLSLTHKDIFAYPNYFVYDGHPNDQPAQAVHLYQGEAWATVAPEDITPQWNELEKYMHRERTINGKRSRHTLPVQRKQIWEQNPEYFISCASNVIHYIEQDSQLVNVADISTEYTDAYVELVTETSTDFFFITEKTVKPLAFGLCFVMVSCYKFLHHLRRLGFKTFDSYIDESYDLVKDNDKRIDMAFKAFKQFVLSDKDFDALQKICDYNRKHLKYLQDTYTFSDRQWKKLSRVIDF